jgi:nitrate/TMAO reductase-like tetraheme cytochrome c subunit
MTAQPAHKGLYRNWMTYFGGIVTLVGVLLVAFFVLLEFSLKHPSPYIGIFTFVVFPGVILFGVLVGLLGMRMEALRRRKSGATEALPYPALDLNDPSQRTKFGIGVVVSAVLLVVLSFTGYNGFLLTESVGFCGSTCHVMQPELTTYLNSAHARVRCVECHVGEGAGWYVNSKLSGTRQLFAVLFHTYDRPIATPVKNLRPARETCQRCHWPEKFVQAQLYQRPHFRYDEKNTAEQITLLVKTGGGGENGGGIHWHMFIENKVEYVAEDTHLQEIPWTRVRRRDGTSVEYFRQEKKLVPEQLAALKVHQMDCMDCHNRPAHNFETPDLAVDRALSAGVISPSLPFAKSIAVDALSREYPDATSAHSGMRRELTAFYDDKYKDVATARAGDVKRAADALVAIYDRNVFPDMKVSWSTYPSNIGHRNWPGCFRCHDGKHVSPDGQVLTSECTTCHTNPIRGPQAGFGEVMANKAQPDWHPWEMPEKHLAIAKHSQIQCHECHLAGRRPKTECKDCHH